MIINMVETGAFLTGGGGVFMVPTLAPAPVYTNNYVLYKYSWTDVQETNKIIILVNASNIFNFFINVLMLDDRRIKGLKEEPIKYPANFSKFNSNSIIVTFQKHVH